MQPGLLVYVTMLISPLAPFMYDSLAVGAGGVRPLRFQHGNTKRVSVYRDKASSFALCLERDSLRTFPLHPVNLRGHFPEEKCNRQVATELRSRGKEYHGLSPGSW